MSDFLNRDLRKNSYLSICSSVNRERIALKSTEQDVVVILHNKRKKARYLSVLHKVKPSIIFWFALNWFYINYNFWKVGKKNIPLFLKEHNSVDFIR